MSEPTAAHPMVADPDFDRDLVFSTRTDVRVSHIVVAGMASIVARAGNSEELATAVRDRLGIELPRTPRLASAHGLSLAWAGPEQWLARSETSEGRLLESRLRTELGALAAVADQSDSRVVFRIEGPQAREILAKGVPVDLHSEAFAVNDVATTLFGHIGVQIWLLDRTPVFDLLVARSYALSFWRLLSLTI